MELGQQSLITDEHRALIGQRGEPFTVTVNGEDGGRMRDVLEDADPRWAAETGQVPPYILSMVASGGGPRSAPSVRILPGALLTQQEWSWERHLRAGEQLTGYTHVADIRERLGGRYGHSVLVTNRTDYYDTDNNLVASTMITITQFDPNAGAAS